MELVGALRLALPTFWAQQTLLILSSIGGNFCNVFNPLAINHKNAV